MYLESTAELNHDIFIHNVWHNLKKKHANMIGT